MSKIKGQDLVVMFRDETDQSWKAVAYATDCELDINVSMLETGSQDSGKWAEQKPKKVSWRVTSAHLLSDVEQPVDFDALIAAGTKVQICFSCVAPHPEPKDDPPQYEPQYRFFGPPYGYAYTRTGYAYISRHTVTARHRTYVTSSIELAGTGPLESGTADHHDFGPTNAPDFNTDFNV